MLCEGSRAGDGGYKRWGVERPVSTQARRQNELGRTQGRRKGRSEMLRIDGREGDLRDAARRELGQA